MQITFDWPVGKLSPNARVHWSKKAKAVKSYRTSCAWAARAAGVKSIVADGEVAMTITFYPPDNRRRDRDNMIAAFKSGLDGLSDAMGVDDSLFVPTYRVGPAMKPGRIVVTL